METIDLKLTSYVGPLYVFKNEDKFFLCVENVNNDSIAEISEDLYNLLIKELRYKEDN